MFPIPDIVPFEYYEKDPGAVQHGNFINYYCFNKVEERLKLLPKGVWKTGTPEGESYIVLDVGCNSGNLTQQLKTFFETETDRNVIVLGIDMDPNLIHRAKEDNTDSNITFQTVNIMEDSNCIQEFLKSHNRTKFDIVCLFSITMWIHLNNHDEGLRAFLEKSSELAEILVVEPQPWKCYPAAMKRVRRGNAGENLFPHYKTLEWRVDVEDRIERFLVNNLKREMVYETDRTKWKRKICIFK